MNVIMYELYLNKILKTEIIIIMTSHITHTKEQKKKHAWGSGGSSRKRFAPRMCFLGEPWPALKRALELAAGCFLHFIKCFNFVVAGTMKGTVRRLKLDNNFTSEKHSVKKMCGCKCF